MAFFFIHNLNKEINMSNTSKAPSIEDSYAMGAKGGESLEEERLAFESWMRGHCWELGAIWDGKSYKSQIEINNRGCFDPVAGMTRRLWAAWRDRAALSRLANTSCNIDHIQISEHQTIVDNLKNEITELKAYDETVSAVSIQEGMDIVKQQSEVIDVLQDLLLEIKSSKILSDVMNKKIINALKIE
jgi:hypothetical protein